MTVAVGESGLPPYEPWENPLTMTVMGSDSDLVVMQEAPDMLDKLGVPNDIDFVSAHRTPEDMRDFALSLSEKAIGVVIAGAGGAAHLPGMLEAFAPANTVVIGVPVWSSSTKVDAATPAIQQMPPGKPVGTMSINGSKNAGIYATKVLSCKYPDFVASLENYSQSLKDEIAAKRDLREKLGYREYQWRVANKALGLPKAEDVGRGGFLPGIFVPYNERLSS